MINVVFDLSKNLAFVAIIFFVSDAAYSQTGQCGTIDVPYNNYTELKKGNSIRLKSTCNIRIRINIITQDDGFHSVMGEDMLTSEIDITNTYLDSVGINLSISDFNYIANSYLYDFDDLQEGIDGLASFNESGVIDIYIVSNLLQHGTCAFTTVESIMSNVIVIDRTCSNAYNFAHQVGHYLGLIHPHSIGNGVELVDRSNCEVAGDFLCDTPADPDLTFAIIDSDCVYQGMLDPDDELDPNGDRYKPDVELVMSYTTTICGTRFTAQQGMVMKNVIDSFYPDIIVNPGTVSSSSESSNIGITVYPNPASDMLNIDISDNMMFEAKLFDLNGNHVRVTVDENKINIKGLAEGVYILILSDSNLGIEQVERIVIHR